MAIEYESRLSHAKQCITKPITASTSLCQCALTLLPLGDENAAARGIVGVVELRDDVRRGRVTNLSCKHTRHYHHHLYKHSI